MTKLLLGVALCLLASASAEYKSEFKILPDHKVFNDYSLPLPSTYLESDDLPKDFSWDNVKNASFLTKNLNQHIPQYCGSCWAHGALSAMADRIKIARGGKGTDVNLAIQFILNCGGKMAGSCHGGSATGTYEFIKHTGYVPFDTCQPYIACSSESHMGFCGRVDTTCSAINTCRTCSTFNVPCSEIDVFPNASIAEFGVVNGEENMMAEIYARGPIACGVDAEPILEYTGGVFVDDKRADKLVNHIVSVYGWGTDENGTPYWKVRNSWGEYWGENGHFRLKRGENDLGIESSCSWATVDAFTESNYPCYEDGSNCVGTNHVKDPALDVSAFRKSRGL